MNTTLLQQETTYTTLKQQLYNIFTTYLQHIYNQITTHIQQLNNKYLLSARTSSLKKGYWLSTNKF